MGSRWSGRRREGRGDQSGLLVGRQIAERSEDLEAPHLLGHQGEDEVGAVGAELCAQDLTERAVVVGQHESPCHVEVLPGETDTLE